MLKNRVFNKEIKYISIKDCDILKKYSVFYEVNKNQVIFYKGHYPYGLFVLLNGDMLIEVNKKNKLIVKAPVILGYNSFIKNTIYPITSISLNNSNILYISKMKYNNELSDNEEIMSILS